MLSVYKYRFSRRTIYVSIFYLAVFALLGWALYQFRDRSVGAAEQEKLIFGDLLAGELPPTPCKIEEK